jgi:hypothetical protein
LNWKLNNLKICLACAVTALVTWRGSKLWQFISTTSSKSWGTRGSFWRIFLMEFFLEGFLFSFHLLKRDNRNLYKLPEIVTSICPTEAKVALVTDLGIPLIKIHTSDLSYQVAYLTKKTSQKLALA